MIKMFFLTFFVAELIIALALIIKIRSADKFVLKLNKQLSYSKGLILPCFSDIRTYILDISSDINDFKLFVLKKRDEYTLNFAKTLLSYSLIFALKGKYKKTFIAYQLAKEIYEGCLES